MKDRKIFGAGMFSFMFFLIIGTIIKKAFNTDSEITITVIIVSFITIGFILKDL